MQGIEGRVTTTGDGTGRTRTNGDRAELTLESPADAERLHTLVEKLLVRNQQLEQALESRVVIEQAKGVLAERLRLDPEAAFELLRRAARNNRMKIHDLAVRVIDARKTPREIEDVLA